MNRRNFLKGTVAGAVAIAMGRSFTEPVEAAVPYDDLVDASRFTDPNAWYIKGGENVPMYWREPWKPCSCTVMDWLPGRGRVSPRFDCVQCHNCGGYITDERLEDFGTKQQQSDAWFERQRAAGTVSLRQTPLHDDLYYLTEDGVVRFDGTSNAISKPLTEASLEELLVEIQKSGLCGPLVIRPKFVKW